jgi:galactokinase
MQAGKIFIEKFSSDPEIFRSPGRINVLGEHTDYNDGFVLPAAINLYIEIAIKLRDDNKINFYSAAFKEAFSTSLDQIQKSDKQWANYALGVIAQFQKKGKKISGFDMVIDGNVPIGAGLSSSAAFEAAVAFAINELNNTGIDKRELAKMAQLAEHEYAGVMCGIMDQFASLFGKKDHLIRLDCRSLEFDLIPIQLEGYEFLLLNSNVKHNLASSEYNTRRMQCEQGVSWLKELDPDIKSLRDAKISQLTILENKDETVYHRCLYVVSENQRVLDLCSALENHDLKRMGEIMYETHEGLSKDYEVSCAELDFLVNEAKKHDAILGARMMGGGFGGCMITLCRSDAASDVINRLNAAYQSAFNKELTPYIVTVEDGTSQITKTETV